MSLVLSLLMIAEAVATVAPPAATAEEENDIVVVARRASWWSGTYNVSNGVTTCVTRVSTGDAEIDTIMCNSLVICAPRYVPEMEAAARARQASQHPLTREELAAFARPYNERIFRCGRREARPAFLALVRRRRAAR